MAVTVVVFADGDLHRDALPCVATLRRHGLRLGAAGNMRSVQEDFLRPHVDFVGSSERWAVEKPDPGFFARLVEEAAAPAADVLFVGDPVDNDMLPALAAGLRAVRIRRGAHVHVESPEGAVTIDSLDELPEALARV